MSRLQVRTTVLISRRLLAADFYLPTVLLEMSVPDFIGLQLAKCTNVAALAILSNGSGDGSGESFGLPLQFHDMHLLLVRL